MLNISDQVPWIYNTDHSRIWLSPMWLPEVVIIVVAHHEQQSQIPYFWPEKESKFMTWRVSSQQIRCWQPLSYLINRVKPFGGKRDHLHYSSGNRVWRTCEGMVVAFEETAECVGRLSKLCYTNWTAGRCEQQHPGKSMLSLTSVSHFLPRDPSTSSSDDSLQDKQLFHTEHDAPSTVSRVNFLNLIP